MRDVLLNKEPKDWDVTTDATPEEIQELFPKHFYANTFGTVTVLVGGKVGEVEVTPYRVESDYSDKRHPDNVLFTDSLKEDLARRDFTVNAMAGVPENQGLRLPGSGDPGADTVVVGNLRIVDPFGGIRDLDAKTIRAVGGAGERFEEDALRLLRAVRLAAELGFSIEESTAAAIRQQAESVRAVSQERIRDEFLKMVGSDRPELALNTMQQLGLLAYTIPELEEGVGVAQNKHHIYTVFEHNVKSLQFAADFGYPLYVRLAALFHDVGKPKTRRFDKKQGDYTFYGHDIVGARMTEKILKRLRLPTEIVRTVSHLVRHHMFYYDMGQVTEAGIRRLLSRVGKEHFDDLIKVRKAERKGSGVPKAEPYRLRHLQFMVEKVSQEPISVGQLKIDGGDLMTEMDLKPGPVIGGILQALLAEVIEDPKRNEREYLLERAEELKNMDPKELKELGVAAAEAAEAKREEEIRGKYHV